MIDKPDPAKDAGRTDVPGQKRPHATVDIKATEVKPPLQTQTPAASASSASSAAAAPGPQAQGSRSSSGKPEAGATSSGASSKPVGPADAATKPSSINTAAKPNEKSDAKPGAAPTPQPTKAGGSAPPGGLLSHLAAGVIGGALVYAGTALLPPRQETVPNNVTNQLAERISALEAAPKGGDADALAAKVADAEGRLARLDELARSVDQLRDGQTALQSETKALREAAQGGGVDAATAERVSKLEDQLKMIASEGAGADGNVPQLAAISGKIADLESSLEGEIAELRKNLPADVSGRMASTLESSEAARAAALRLDRELSAVRTDVARSAQAMETAKADAAKLAASVEAAKAEAGKASNAVGELRSSIDSQLKTFAKPEDIAGAIGPVNTKIAEIEQNVRGVVSSEQNRRQNAERIVLSLELSNLKRALDRGLGQGYAAELESVRKASAGQLDLDPLERFKDTGVATPGELKAEFRTHIDRIIDADVEPANGSVIDRLLAGAKSVVRVRKIDHEAGDTSTEAIVGRIETALDEERLDDALTHAKSLPQRARVPIEDWIIKVTARDTVDQAIAGIEATLKASLAGAPDAQPAAAPAPVQN